MYVLTTAISLALLGLVSASPQRNRDDYEDVREVTQSLPGYTKLSDQQVKHLQNRGFGSTVLTFRPTPAYDDNIENEEEIDSSPASSQVRTPTYAEENYPVRNAIPVVQQRPQQRIIQQQPQQQYIRRQHGPQDFRQQLAEEAEDAKLEEKEEEEPDRLSLLLPQSKFECNGKNTGYYADEGLGCEVFHYCQDNGKHSWICPEGFTFHQVHLICMPPGGDNICEKSAQFHFVNEYLYKPLNLEEHQQRPNITLKYSDRYYPDSYYQQEYEEEEEPTRQSHRNSVRVPVQQIPQQPPIVAVVRRPPPTQYTPTIRPETTIGQFFRSPEEINIPLQQRRPLFVAQRYTQEY